MAPTLTRVTHPGVLPDLAGQRPLTCPWFPDGWPERAGHSPCGCFGPLGLTPAQPWLAGAASSVEPRRFTADRATS